MTALLAEAGLTRRAVTAEEIRSIQPAITGDFVGGYYTDSDFTGDIHRYTMGLAQGIAGEGADLRYGTEIAALAHTGTGVRVTWVNRSDRQSEEFDAIVICAGPFAQLG